MDATGEKAVQQEPHTIVSAMESSIPDVVSSSEEMPLATATLETVDTFELSTDNVLDLQEWGQDSQLSVNQLDSSVALFAIDGTEVVGLHAAIGEGNALIGDAGAIASGFMEGKNAKVVVGNFSGWSDLQKQTLKQTLGADVTLLDSRGESHITAKNEEGLLRIYNGDNQLLNPRTIQQTLLDSGAPNVPSIEDSIMSESEIRNSRVNWVIPRDPDDVNSIDSMFFNYNPYLEVMDENTPAHERYNHFGGGGQPLDSYRQPGSGQGAGEGVVVTGPSEEALPEAIPVSTFDAEVMQVAERVDNPSRTGHRSRIDPNGVN